MRIDFIVSATEIFSADWPIPPRVGENVCLAGEDYVVIAVNWGHHVTGDGKPLMGKPCVVVDLSLDLRGDK